MYMVAGDVGVGVRNTDQKVGGSDPFGRTILTPALTSTNGRG